MNPLTFEYVPEYHTLEVDIKQAGKRSQIL